MKQSILVSFACLFFLSATSHAAMECKGFNKDTGEIERLFELDKATNTLFLVGRGTPHDVVPFLKKKGYLETYKNDKYTIQINTQTNTVQIAMLALMSRNRTVFINSMYTGYGCE